MKKITKLLFSIFLILLWTSCNQDEIKPIQSQKYNEKVFRINPSEEPFLLDKINSFFNSTNGRVASSENINWETAIKVIDDANDKIFYSFEYLEPEAIEFSNFVLTETNSLIDGYTLTYAPDREWLNAQRFDLLNFNGAIIGRNSNGDTISYAEIINGKTLQIEGNSNGRVQKAALPPFPEAEGCYELIYSAATGSYWWQVIACGGGSGGTSGGSSGSGGTGTGGTGSTSGGDGSSGGTGAGGDSGSSSGGASSDGTGYHGGSGTGSGSSGSSSATGTQPRVGPGVIYNEFIEYDIKVDTTIVNHPKAKCIYDKLGGTATFQNLIKDFDNNGGELNLTFELGKLDTVNGVCRTQYPYRDVTIIIDKQRLENRRTIEGARTFLHESVHAKIFTLLRQIGGYDNLSADNFPELFNAYVDYKSAGKPDPGSQAQHEYMAQKYVDSIAEGLKQFDTMNHSNPEITMDHYLALAWGGLEGTKAFNNLSQVKKDKIRDDRDLIFSWYSTINCK